MSQLSPISPGSLPGLFAATRRWQVNLWFACRKSSNQSAVISSCKKYHLQLPRASSQWDLEEGLSYVGIMQTTSHRPSLELTSVLEYWSGSSWQFVGFRIDTVSQQPCRERPRLESQCGNQAVSWSFVTPKRSWRRLHLLRLNNFSMTSFGRSSRRL